MRSNLRQGLDRDVYQVVRKLEDNGGTGAATVLGVLHSIKKSNSSLARLKKKPLEDSIERVLHYRQSEILAGNRRSDCEESEIEGGVEVGTEANAALSTVRRDDQRFLLNKQIAKMWQFDLGPATESGPVGQKRKRGEGKDVKETALGTDATSTGSLAQPAHPVIESMRDSKTSQKKSSRPSPYLVEHSPIREMLGGLDDVLDELHEHAQCLLNRQDLYRNAKWRRIHGILISGPSGTGKKSLVRAVAAIIDRPLLRLSGCFDDPDRVEKNLADALEEAKCMAPCLILIERLHHHLAKTSGSSGHAEGRPRNVVHFEKFMERLRTERADDRPVLVIGTTSRIEDVDTDMLGLGMLERIVKIQLPDTRAREAILRVVTRDAELPANFDYGSIARLTHGFVGADLIHVVTLAMERVRRRCVDSERDRAPTMLKRSEVDSERGLWQSYNDSSRVFVEQTPGPFTISDLTEVIQSYMPLTRQQGFSTIPSTTWARVGALTRVRDSLSFSIIQPIRHPDRFARFGIGKSAGVLLWGPPGCGKTLVAQAVANDAQASFIAIKGPELLNKYVGESERAVRDLFARARSSAPCILFFDEMDSLVPRRDNTTTEAGTRVVNALLAELDGAQDRTGVFVIGTTNRPDMIDPAMLRPGRLDVKLFLDLPTPDERVDILRAIVCSNLPSASAETDSGALAALEAVARDERCTDFSGADLQGLFRRAAERAFKREHERSEQDTTVATGDAQILETDWEAALGESKPSVKDPGMYRALLSKIG